MNPLEKESFNVYWDVEEGRAEDREEILKDNLPTIDEVVDFVADESIDHSGGGLRSSGTKNKTMLDKLYFIYRTRPISDSIGWSTQPGDYGIGGLLKVEFYKKLFKKLDHDDQMYLFPYIPGEMHTDDMLIDYLSIPPLGGASSLGNYHGKKPKQKTLEWMLDKRIDTVKQWKPEWWTPKLKTLALKNEPFAIVYIPEDLLTFAEIRNYLKDVPKENQRFMPQFWNKLPDKFKNDPEIFARWLVAANGLKNNYKENYSGSYYTKEAIAKYFEYMDRSTFSDWKLINDSWKTPDFIDIAIKRVAGAIAIDEKVELTKSILERTLAGPMSTTTRAKIALRLENEGRLTKELVEQVDTDFWGIEDLDDADIKKLLKNEHVVDRLVKIKDSDFLNKKANWPRGMKVKKEHIIDMISAFNHNLKKITTRFKTSKFSDDDYAYAFLEANKLEGYERGRAKQTLELLVKNGILSVSDETINLLDTLGPDVTYEGYKDSSDIFLF